MADQLNIKVTPDDTAEDIIEAIANLRASQKRAPLAMTPRYHAVLDYLVTELEWRRMDAALGLEDRDEDHAN
jgi:hypothetical protein